MAVQVLRKFPEVHLVTWECALRHASSWAEVEAWAAVSTPVGRFMAAVMANSFGGMQVCSHITSELAGLTSLACWEAAVLAWCNGAPFMGSSNLAGAAALACQVSRSSLALPIHGVTGCWLCGCMQDKDLGGLGYPPCDPLAVAVALAPSLVKDSRKVFVDVEVEGSIARGMSVFDWGDLLKKQHNVSLVQQVDRAQFANMMLNLLQ